MKKMTLPRIAKILAKSNDGVKPSVEWVERMKTVTCPTGYKVRTGKVRVSAEGFRTRIMTVDHCEMGVDIF